jgi:hypothetical protein
VARDDALEAALRKFPHFENDAPITPDAVAAVANEYIKMILEWTPFGEGVTFFDQEGIGRTIEYSTGDRSAGIPEGWTIPEDADWKVVPADEALPAPPPSTSQASVPEELRAAFAKLPPGELAYYPDRYQIRTDESFINAQKLIAKTSCGNGHEHAYSVVLAASFNHVRSLLQGGDHGER